MTIGDLESTCQDLENDQRLKRRMFLCSKLDAAHGLMRILPRQRDIIQREATALYLDRKQPTDIRILSSVLIFKSKPALSLLQVLAGRLLREPNDQVRSFVVSMIKEVDSFDYPCFRGL